MDLWINHWSADSFFRPEACYKAKDEKTSIILLIIRVRLLRKYYKSNGFQLSKIMANFHQKTFEDYNVNGSKSQRYCKSIILCIGLFGEFKLNI